MKNNCLLFLALTCCTKSALPQVKPNSIRFDVENYIAVDNSGRYYPYTSHGFYENATGTAKPRVFILPNFKLELDKIKVSALRPTGQLICRSSADTDGATDSVKLCQNHLIAA